MKHTVKLQQVNLVNTVIGSVKKKKIKTTNQDTNVANTNAQEGIPTSKRYSDLYETDHSFINTSTNFDLQTKIIKSPPVYIQAQIIDPLMELLEQ